DLATVTLRRAGGVRAGRAPSHRPPPPVPSMRPTEPVAAPPARPGRPGSGLPWTSDAGPHSATRRGRPPGSVVNETKAESLIMLRFAAELSIKSRRPRSTFHRRLRQNLKDAPATSG